MVSLQNVLTIAIFLKFLLVSSSLAGNFTRSCEKFGGDVDNKGECICNRLQNALQLDMKTTISPRFKNYVQFKNINKLVVKYSGLFKFRKKELKCNLLLH